MARGSAAVAVAHGPRRVDVPGTAATLDLRTMGGRIAWSRMRLNLTQAEVARRAFKSRATVVQYENNNITPPIEEIVKLSVALDVSPEFLAFGRQGVDGLQNAAEEIIAVEEISEGRDGTYVSGKFAIPRKVFEEKGVEPGKARMFVLNHEENQFDFSIGDRLILDTGVKEIVRDHDLYLLNTSSGATVVRREPIGAPKGSIMFTTGRGVSKTLKPGSLDIVGAVVGKFSLSA